MNTFLTVYVPYIIIATMLFLISMGGYHLIIKPYKSVKHDTKSIQDILSKIQKHEETSIRFNEFNKWVQENSASDYLQNCFKPAWDNYYKKFMQLQQNGVAFTPDVYDFFVEDMFVNKFGKRKLVEIIPGIFLALGIIGTFVGIAAGVSGLDPKGDADTMKAGIGVLLSGMKVKFLSSIFGIIFSVVWQIVDKWVYYPMLIDSFMKIRQRMDETFPTQEESTVLYQMFKNQEKQITDFQGFLTEIMIPNMVSGFSEAINQSLAPHLEQTQTIMSDMVKSASTNQLEGMNTMIDHFVSSLSEITGEHMKGLGEALQTTIEWQKRVHTEMSELVQSMQESAKGQSLMVEKTTSLTEQIHGYTDKLTDYQAVFENTISQLNETTDKNSHLQTSISELLEKMTEERKAFDQYFTEHLETLKSNVELVVTQTEHHTNLHDKLETNLEKMNVLTESQQLLSETLAKQAELSQQSHQDFTTLLEQMNQHGDTYANLQQGLNETTEKNSHLQETIAQLLEKMVEEREVFHQHFDNHLGHLESHVGAIVSQTEQQVQMQTKLEVNLQQIQNLAETQQTLATTLANQAELAQESNSTLTALLEQIANHGSMFGELQEELKEALEATIKERQHLDQMMNDLYEGLTDQLQQMDQRSETLKQTWDSNKEAIVTANKHLSQSMNQFTDDMHRGLANTFTQFDEELAKSVQHLSKGVNAIQEGIIDLPEALDTLKQSVTVLNKYAQNMVKIGD
jgi:DNA repair exonuclease SbcCD ATPase subunit